MGNANSQINKEHTKKDAEVLKKIRNNKWKDEILHKGAKYYQILKDNWDNEKVARVDKIPQHCPPLCIRCGKYFDKCLVTGAKVIAVLHNQITTNLEIFECSGCGAIVAGDDYKRVL